MGTETDRPMIRLLSNDWGPGNTPSGVWAIVPASPARFLRSSGPMRYPYAEGIFLSNVTDIDTRTAELVAKLLRGDGTELNAYIVEIANAMSISKTQARASCHGILLDNQAVPRVKDLARAMVFRIIDYAIPRSEVTRAKERDQRLNTTAGHAELLTKARQLFTSLTKTGEGGELLLYLLAQSYLRLPQLFCKMALKTNAQMHVHGADGVHVDLTSDPGALRLYWGEAKMFANIKDATRHCLDDLKPFVCPVGGSASRDERDLQLIRDNIDLENPELEDVILQYLNRDNPAFVKLHLSGLGLIAYDHAGYPNAPKQLTQAELTKQLQADLQQAINLLGDEIVGRDPLHTVDLHFFLVPMPSVAEFRKAFLEELGHG